ncbi:hypothetical protein SJAV_15040 [Sulfurisphaera javensis]|uniref:Uncharacterized protein n=1 Tax=Sulfurisphaera javensis TaxID=2049879 RepID=A0AAT9GS01_9CREN
MLLTNEILNASKVIRYKKEDCEIYLVEKEGENYLIGIYQGKNTTYAKVTLSYAKWDCDNILYYPFGYFAFALNENELIEKIKVKIDELKRNVIR